MTAAQAHSVAATERGVPRGSRLLALLVLATLGGGAVALLSALGPSRQILAVLGLGLGFPALVLFLVRPHTAFAAYLLVLPLVTAVPVAAGLNAGEALTLAMLLLGVFGLWDVWDRVVPSIRRLAPILWPLAGLVVISMLSLLANGILAFEDVVSALFKMVAFGALAVLAHVHADTPDKARMLLAGVVAGAAAVSIYSVVAWAFGWSYSAEYDWNRASGTFENWNQLGGFLALLAPPTLALAATTRRPTLRLLLGVVFLLEIIALLLSLTLGAMVGLATGGVFALVFLMRLSWRRIVPTILLALIGFGVVFATNPLLADKLSRFDERVLDRLMTYAVGINMFRDKFWLGFGSEWRLADELAFGKADYGITVFGVSGIVPHNSFLKIGVEKGIFGVVLLTLLLVGSLRLLFRHRHALMASRYGPLYPGMAAGMIAFFVQNMTNELILHARIGIIFFALLAIYDQIGRMAEADLRSADGSIE